MNNVNTIESGGHQQWNILENEQCEHESEGHQQWQSTEYQDCEYESR